MAHTPLFAAVERALALASRDNSVVWSRTSALPRRTLLRSSAAAVGAAALSPLLDWSAYAQKEQPKGSIGIVGGGVAGLTAAYRLHQAGRTPVLFEASNRWGGRMFTVPQFYKGMFCELGGELVDTNHKDLRELLADLRNLHADCDLDRQKFCEKEGQDLYFFKGHLRTDKDLLDWKTSSGAFVPIAKRIRDDAAQLRPNGPWTAHARDLDNKSLKDYLEECRGKTECKTEDWVIDLLDAAYVNECGLETEQLSSLNLVDFIGTALDKPFQIYGDSDEAYRIKGGSSTLIKALVDALEHKIEMNLNYALTRIEDENGPIALSFDVPGGAQRQRTFDAVILALPFTCLRKVDGLDHLGLSDAKLNCINKLGMGQSAKIMVGTKSRVWRNPEPGLWRNPEPGLPPSDGSILSDLRFQEFWETSRGQLGDSGDLPGILTVFLGGNRAEKTDEKSALAEFHDDLAKISPKMADSLDLKAVTSMFWSNYRYTLGSYSAAKVGQYTTMLDEAGKPALGGRLHFAGEHTAGPKLFGYMNAGVFSGNRAAIQLGATIPAPPIDMLCPSAQQKC